MTEDLLRPLLLEMQKNNAFQKELLAKKVEDEQNTYIESELGEL